MPSVALGGIWHETNTFAPIRTELVDFERYQLARGDDLVARYAQTQTELGGAFSACLALGVRPVPLIYAAAVPSGIVSGDAYRCLSNELVEALVAERCDAIVLVLHGAMVAEGHPDADAELVEAVRLEAGDRPVVVTLDFHANLDTRLTEAADLIVAYDTYPHTDMASRGEEAVGLALRLLERERPNVQLEKLPLLTVPQVQETAAEPLAGVMRSVAQAEATDSVWTASVVAGYPYADVARLGAAVYVAAEGDASEQARRLATEIWTRRADFVPELVEPDHAVAGLDRALGGVILVDVADNFGGGSPGDGTVLLQLLEERGRRDAAVVIWDPVCLDEIYASNRGQVIAKVGGRASPDLGETLTIRGGVRRLGRVQYTRTGAYMGGQAVDMGRVAVIESASGAVVVTEHRVMPFDDDHLRAVGIDPADRKVIVVKSAIAWRSAFAPYNKRPVFVRTPGYCPSDLRQLEFAMRPRPAYPLEDNAQWP